VTQTEQEPDNRLQAMIEEVHLDALRHPDPCGSGLLTFLEAIQQHAEGEASTVQTYARIASETSDPVVAVVMELLVDEEQRHHALFQRIGASLRDRFNWAESSALPLDAAPTGRTDPQTIRLLRDLEAEERRGAQALRDLAHPERPGQSGLICLLLQAMAMDSDKHARLLAFVAERLASQS
jgi:hypothetical protein